MRRYSLKSRQTFEFEISRAVFPLLEQMFSANTLYRSIGIVLEEFNSCEQEQLLLFDENPETRAKRAARQKP